MQNKNYLSLFVWIISLNVISSLTSSLTQSETRDWYGVINRSSLTPPNYLFPIVWTILYCAIGVSGWFIWRLGSFYYTRLIKILYMTQLILNWSWSPLFFYYHLTGIAFFVLICMDILVAALIWISYSRLKPVSILTIPYWIWILFATYLNFYIWWYN